MEYQSVSFQPRIDSPNSLIDRAKIELESELVKHFAADLYNSYPYLLDVNGQSIYPGIERQLSSNNITPVALLEIQRSIYGALEAHEQSHPDWYSIYHALHINLVRNSALAKHCLSQLLDELQSAAKKYTYKRLLVPASGKFFEFPEVLNKFNSELVVAEDVDSSAIEFTRGMFSGHPKLILRHSDLSKPQSDTVFYDALLFFHPHVTDYDELSNSGLYKKYGDEFYIPYDEVKKQKKGKYISDLWVEIITSSLARLKVGGYAFFVFYEYRELDIVTEWLKEFNQFEVVHSPMQRGYCRFLFCKRLFKLIRNRTGTNSKICCYGGI